MKRPDTRLARQFAKLDGLPASNALKTFALRRTVPFLGTAGVRFVSVEPGLASLALDSRRRVHNHIQGMHAAAAALLAEATSGLVLSYHLPDDRLPLLVRSEVEYLSRMKGGLVARATLDEETAMRIENEERSQATFHVEIEDEAGTTPLEAAMTWAWRPRR